MTPLRRGFLWAVAAAVTFGATTPLIAHVATDVGPWSTAGWLYLGGTAFAMIAYREPRALLQGLRSRWPALAAIAVIGGTLAPAAYVLGLRATGPLSASLALNMEAPFSALVAAVAFREHIGGRVVLAMALIVAGASLLAQGQNHGGGSNAGVLFVVLATALWAVDNALSSRLSELDPRVTVLWKSAIGCVLSLVVGALLGERSANPAAAVSLVAIGSIGYGASLVFYLVAQKNFGVARTASVFAVAPFIGAVIALLAGDGRLGWTSAAAFALMATGAYLHASERHAHAHRHEPVEHEHAHRHDDLHHDHAHEPPVRGEHDHRHVHDPVLHAHEHASDSEHLHYHGDGTPIG